MTEPARKSNILSEAGEAAAILVSTLRSIRTGFLSGNERATLIKKLQPHLATPLTLYEDKDQEWVHLSSQLTLEFEANPAAALKAFDAAEWPRPFALVLREELGEVAARRYIAQHAGDKDIPDPVLLKEVVSEAEQMPGDARELAARKNLFGISFSGGGIRSATFNLGVVQFLAKFGLFRKIDFLSTVSGGGYIGAWLHAWSYRDGIEQVEKVIGQEPWREPTGPDTLPLRFLRQFSSYLTPQNGFFSFDTWTMFAVYVRNVVLNQATLIAWFGVLLLLPRFFVFPMLYYSDTFASVSAWWISLGIACLAFSMAFIGLNLHYATRGICKGKAPTASPPFASTDAVQVSCVVTMFLGALFSSIWIWQNIRNPAFQTIDIKQPFWWCAALVFALFSLSLSWGGGFWSCFKKRLVMNSFGWAVLVFTLVTAASTGAALGLLRGYLILIQYFDSHPVPGIWHETVWGAPLLLIVLLVAGTLEMGLLGIDLQDSGREWLSRFRAVINLYSLFWLALFCAAIYGPHLVITLAGDLPGKWTLTGGGLAWVGSTAASLFAGQSALTGSKKDGAPTFSTLDLIAKAGPPVFIIGFVLVISTALHLLLSYGRPFEYWALLSPPDQFWTAPGWLVTSGSLFIALLASALVLTWRIDINEFSMHHFYKNRLVRCYLGASNVGRKPNPFTGFDTADDLPLSKFAPSSGYPGPYPLINATLNLSAGGQLAWQERKAASFIFSPRSSGFDLSGRDVSPDSDHPGSDPVNPEIRPCAYRRTELYGGYQGGPRLGTVTAISGAAADPNMGYNTSPAVAFLMTVFDVRLGWWMGNPRRDKQSHLSSPVFGLVALLSELLGRTDDRTRFVSLSDGGHFDNMGLYELVRRRCTYVVVCDSEGDGGYKFGGLGMVIRKCRIDFGVEIDIDPSLIAPQAARSQAHCAVGTITYPDGHQGTLVYIKSSLTGDEPEDVLQFAGSHPSFPHESTADQWFGESQFESYRKLGFHAAQHTFESASRWYRWDSETPSVPKLFEALRNHWYPLNPNLRQHAIEHTATLNELLSRIATTPELHPMGRTLFPNGELPPLLRHDTNACSRFRSWFHRDPAKPLPLGDKVQEFYFAMNILQLVEDLYFDFELDNSRWFADPRIQGWQDLFRTWKNSEAVASAWRAQSRSFRKDFQNFWETQVDPTPRGDSLSCASPLRIGHRGCAGHAPENTLAAVSAGLRLKVDFIEVDLQTSRDGVFVVMHDKRVDRTTSGTGRVQDLTLRQLRSFSTPSGKPVPTLEELLDAVGGRCGLILEIIQPGTGVHLLSRVQRSGYKGPIIYSSFLHEEILAIRQREASCLTLALMEGIPVGGEKFALDARATHVGLALESLTEDFVKECRQRGLKTFVYTVNDPQDVARVRRWGVDGLISDFPERI